MKKLYILLITALFLVSCWTEEKIEVKKAIDKKLWIIEDTWNIMNEYADTLEWSIWDAKAVRDLMNQKNDKLKESLRTQ